MAIGTIIFCFEASFYIILLYYKYSKVLNFSILWLLLVCFGSIYYVGNFGMAGLISVQQSSFRFRFFLVSRLLVWTEGPTCEMPLKWQAFTFTHDIKGCTFKTLENLSKNMNILPIWRVERPGTGHLLLLPYIFTDFHIFIK